MSFLLLLCKLSVQSVWFLECEKQVNDLKAKLEQLETENVRVKQLVHEAEEKCRRIEKSTQCDGLCEEQKQGECVSTDDRVPGVDDSCVVDAGSQTPPRTVSQFVSVSTLLSPQTSDVGIQHRHGRSVSSPHQCQHGSAMTSRVGQSTSHPVLSPSTRMVTSQSGMVTQPDLMTSQPRIMTSEQQFIMSVNSRSASDGRHVRRQRIMSDCSRESLSETTANQMTFVSSHEAGNKVVSSPTCGVASYLLQSPNNGQFQSPSSRPHPANQSSSLWSVGVSQPMTSNRSNVTYPSGQFVNSSGEQAVNYSANCLLVSQCDVSENRQIRHPDGSRRFPPCRQSGNHDSSSDMSLCLPSAECDTQMVSGTMRGTQRRETSFSVRSLTGQAREQRSLSLPIQRVVESSQPSYCLASIQQSSNGINPRAGQLCSRNQWQHAPSVGYSPSNYVTPHRQFEGSFSIDAIQGNRSMPSRPRHANQTFSIERLTSSGFDGQRTPSQSRFDVQSMITSRAEHVTPRETPSQWDGRLNYTVTTRLLGNDHHRTHAQENGLTNSEHYLTHFNAANADCSSPTVFCFQPSEWSSPSMNCQWQHNTTQPVRCHTVNQPSWSTSEVRSQPSEAYPLSWQFRGYRGD